MIESQGLGGDVGQLMVNLFGRCTYYHNCSRDSRPDCDASNSAIGAPANLLVRM
jgi:hypothetical protein